jgi:LAO/AO transport system kinase
MSEQKGRFQKRGGTTFSIPDLYEGILKKNRSSLARAITLIESNAVHHFSLSQELLQKILPHSGRSLRIGITGVPGAGKSTFIEAFGMHLCNIGLRVAVLAVDPSSSISGGSILGDKTRMEQLSRHPNAFIRPSPSEGKLGGIHRKTRETMLLCEAAGFDVILVETVGVGQSEAMIRDMVDFFMLLVLTGAGDELQGMKKGIMELVDAIVVNKADGDNKPLALKTKKEYNQILHFLHPATVGWETKAFTCSALHVEGVTELWDMILKFEKVTKESGVFEERRKKQAKQWLYSMISDQLHFRFFQQPQVKSELPNLEKAVMEGELTVTAAIEELFSKDEPIQ